MRFKILTLLAASLLVAACGTTPEETAGGVDAGDAVATTTTTDTPDVTAAPAVPSVTPGSAQDFVVNIGDRVFFDFDKATLSAEAQAVLNRQAAWLRQYPQIAIQVEGHCDERGTREYNLALGERRANAVKEYLMGLGVAEGRVSTISYGKERPAVEGSNDRAWAQNRRSVTRLAVGR